MKLISTILLSIFTTIGLIWTICYAPAKIVVEVLAMSTLIVAVYLLFDIIFLIIKGDKDV
jgi:hypothetical protein